MPKEKKSLRDLVKEFGTDVFEHDSAVILCKLCTKSFDNPRRFTLSQHVSSSLHQRAVKKRLETLRPSTSQTLIETTLGGQKTLDKFNADLCKAMIEADIPLNKLQHPSFKAFLEEYCKKKIPGESSLRKNYVVPIYEEKLAKIRNEIGSSNVWVQIDETTDKTGRAVANVLVGVLDPNKPTKSFLLTSEALEKTNSATISQLFSRALLILWPSGIEYNRVLLFVTDAAAYMVKAAKALKVQFPHMIHATCVAHGLHRVAEEVRTLFPLVDRYVSNMKKVFVKCASRKSLYRESTGLPLPPEPVLTRWGTWLQTALYYADNFTTVKAFVLEALDRSEAASIAIAQDVVSEPQLAADLACIASNFRGLPAFIEKLEARDMTLSAALDILDDVERNIDDLPLTGKLSKVRVKFNSVFAKNTGLQELKKVNGVIRGEETLNGLSTEILPENVQCFVKAPIVSCETERSFSRYKSIFRDNRQRFTFEHLKMHLIINCNL
jgi:hypothetical protein